MNNIKTCMCILWALSTLVVISYYFALTNNVQNLEKQLAQINNDIKNDIKKIHLLEADWSELNNPERLKNLAGQYISLDIIEAEQIISYAALPLDGEIVANPKMYAKNSNNVRKLVNY